MIFQHINTMNKKNFTYKKIIIFVILLVFFLFFSIIFSLININNKCIFNNIYINNIDVSGLTKDQAITKLSEIINNKNTQNITIKNYNFDESIVEYSNFNINYDINKCVDEAYNITRTNNIFYNNYVILNLFFNKKNINIEYTYNNNYLENWINSLNENLENKLIQSSYYLENNNLIITQGISGYLIDKNNFINDFEKLITNFSNLDLTINLNLFYNEPNKININKIYDEIHKEVKNAYYEKNPLKIYSETIGISFDKSYAQNLINSNNQTEYIVPLEITYPNITTKNLDIDIFQDKLSSYKTSYNINDIDRSTNLEIASNKINETILSPGDTFSYNTVVGARSIEAGYKEAKIYSNGKVIDGIGGGICQISSTLYNAVVLANLEVLERYNHQFLTSYVPAGRDATVVYGSKDFKFKNSRSYPIKIKTKVTNGIVTCDIYGLKEETEYNIDFDVQIISTTLPKTLYENDSSLKKGTELIKQNGSNGEIVDVYKLKKSNGTIVSKELLYHDSYKALEKIILKN